MDVGLHALGIGTGAIRSVIDAVAATAERHGFATLWAGEHVVMVDRPDLRYPYSDDGQIAVPADADWRWAWASVGHVRNSRHWAFPSRDAPFAPLSMRPCCGLSGATMSLRSTVGSSTSTSCGRIRNRCATG